MSAMPRKRRLAVKASSVAMGQLRTHAPQQTSKGWHVLRLLVLRQFAPTRMAGLPAPSVEGERRPAYCRVKQCRADQRYRTRIAEQAQCFLAATLYDDDICGLFAMARQNMVLHFFRDIVDLGEIQDLINNSHDMDYLARPVRNYSIHELVGHVACSVRAYS